jgi:hypothetical protein
VLGTAIVRTATSDVGLTGSCERRLRGFVAIVGPRLVRQLERASIYSVEVGGSETRGFTAAAFISVVDGIVARNQWQPVVGVSKNTRRAKVLITCPPLLCSFQFLTGYEALTRGRSGRS